jgi:hypothetical protein
MKQTVFTTTKKNCQSLGSKSDFANQKNILMQISIKERQNKVKFDYNKK